MATKIDIDTLIRIVSRGGRVTTGIDVYNAKGTLLLGRDIVVTNTKILEIIKENDIDEVPLSMDGKSGIWDMEGNLVPPDPDNMVPAADKKRKNSPGSFPGISLNTIEKRLFEIEETKRLAQENYETAKLCIKKALTDIRKNKGQFDYSEVKSHVYRLSDFLTVMDNPFSYLTPEIFSHDDYLYNHSINVCTIGTTVINKFNAIFSKMINARLTAAGNEMQNSLGTLPDQRKNMYRHFQKDEIQNISVGLFLHDIGKVMVPDEILNKAGKLTEDEFNTIKKHSYDFGLSILEKNKIDNPFVTNIIKYHHAPLYREERRCYPQDRLPEEIPIYARACKLADIYDAMTSKRSYREASNQINAVTDIFRSYAKKDTVLQYVLHSFIKSIGIYPPGSIVFLRNGQMGYVLESKGPFVIPFTDTKGEGLSGKPDPFDLSDADLDESLQIDNGRSIRKPCEVFDLLPSYLKPRNP